MRRISCHFEDEASFLDHYHGEAATDTAGPALTFVTSTPLRCDERIRLAIVIGDERHILQMRVAARRPTLEAPGCGVHWQCRAEALADAPWLKMLAEKCDTARRLSTAAGGHTHGTETDYFRKL